MFSKALFLQGVVRYEGKGLDRPRSLGPEFAYAVPAGMTAQPLYFRGGNSSEEMIYVVAMRDGAPMRYFPIGARSSVHVPMRLVEDLPEQTRLELHAAAPEGVSGTVVIDFGLVEL